MGSVLGAVFSTSAAVATNVACTGWNKFNGPASVEAVLFGVRQNTVSQKFSRLFSAIDYKIQRQQLHREDIRDLIDLTTSRVNIYHIVGTLLLTFCMAWFTDVVLTTSDFPAWFIDLYFISNFVAVGFILLCVLLGMYAAIAAKSIGTRLLTSYARLSFPTNQEIEDIKVPMFFNVRDAVKRYRDRIEEYDSLSRQHSLESSRSWESSKSLTSVAKERHDEMAALKREVLSDDDEQHFRRFLEELPRWLVYDVWSRACMTFGMNSMLQALSYFTLGIIWSRSPLSAVLAFFAVRALSILILFTDISDALDDSWQWFFLFLRAIVGPVLSISLLSYQWFGNGRYDTASRVDAASITASLIVMVTFSSQAVWTWYMVFKSKIAPMPISATRTQESLTSEVDDPEKDDFHDPEKTGFHGFLEGYNFAPTRFAHVLEWVRPKRIVESSNTDDPSRTASVFRLNSSMLRRWSGLSADTEVTRTNTRTFNEAEAHDKSKRHDVNGGKAPGVWKVDTREEADPWRQDCLHTDWLPFRAVQRFTWVVMAWWMIASLVHALVITSLTGNGFTGTDQMNSTIPILEPSSLLSSRDAGVEHATALTWPRPSRLFKVAALHCSGTRMWVSSKFSVYALTQRSSADSASLRRVRDGVVGAIFCDDYGCDALSPPSPDAPLKEPWVMTRLESLTAEPKISSLAWSYLQRMVATMPGSHRSELVELPSSWRLVAGAWTECPPARIGVSCASATLAGWDGKTIFVGTLGKELQSKTWTFEARIEVDAAVGLCTGKRRRTRLCLEAAGGPPTTYTDVKAMQVSADGQMLSILLGAGFVDIWDLSTGFTLERMKLKNSYTSMCQYNDNFLLSRQTGNGPVLVKLSLPDNVSNIFSGTTTHGRPSHEAKGNRKERNQTSLLSSRRGWWRLRLRQQQLQTDE